MANAAVTNERQVIVNWFEKNFKEAAKESTKTSRLDDGRVNYFFSVVNDSGFDFSRFSFKVKILDKAAGKEIGSATINAGKWAAGEKKNFKSNIDIPADVKSISFVMYSESLSYDGAPASQGQQIKDIGDFVSGMNVDGGVFGELFGTGGMPEGSVTKTTKTTTTTSNGRTTTTRTTTTNRGGTYGNMSYAKRKKEKELNKKRMGKSAATAWTFGIGIVLTISTLGAIGLGEILSYGIPAAVCLIASLILKITKTNEGARIRAYESKVRKDGNTSLDELSAFVQRPERKVADDLQQMVIDGFFPEGYVDMNNGLFVMTRNGEPIESVSDSVAANKKAKRRAARDKGVIPDTVDDLMTMTDDAEIKKKLKELKVIQDKIDARVAERPQMGKQVQEFVEKYYPEVVRLTDEYNESISGLEAADNVLDKSATEIHASQASLADQAKKIKAQLLKLIDSVVEASHNLLEKLYEDDLMDITTDIASLQTTLASKGLLDSDFDIK